MTKPETCLDALREAARSLGESPSKAAYEESGRTPSSSTIVRTLGGWNEAKRQAGLSVSSSTGSRIGPKPDGVNLPDSESWESLSVDQRWHYRNAAWNTERDRQRKDSLRRWVNERKRASGCADCGEDDPLCLDFHHPEGVEKTAAVSRLVNDLSARERIRAEMDGCVVVCANCHRRRHLDRPESQDSSRSHR